MTTGIWQRQLLTLHGPAVVPVVEQARAVAALVGGGPEVEERILADLGSFLIRVGDESQSWLGRFQGEPLLADLLLRLGSISRYGFETALRHPDGFAQIVSERQFRQVWGRRELDVTLRRELAQLGVSERPECLARFKHRHFLRLILGDLSGGIGFPALVMELSDVTDVIAQAALELATAAVAPRFPGIAELPPEQRCFTVLGMGKLGARELNYSSDVDLIFLYQGPDQVVDGGPDAHDWAQELGKAFISAMEGPPEAGRMYRVDMRLRPEGDRGELALSLRETVDYYYSVGRPWERQAQIKARPLAGDAALGRRYLDAMRPWVYPQDPEWETLEEARSMRRRIEERSREADVKTGAGGIRDIEFLVQFFQLCYGGRITELRERATLPTLRVLADRGIVPRHDARALETDYLWLRMVEHRLQMWEDRQEHELPRPSPLRQALARRCGFSGADALERFDQRHSQVRRRVRDVVARHFLAVTPQDDALLALVVQGEADERLAGSLLAKAGLKDLKRACINLRKLADEPFFVLSRSRTERSLVRILPRLLGLLASSPDGDQALDNLVRIASSVGGRATFYDLLAARPEILGTLVDVAGWSNFLVTLFQDYQGLPDEIMDALNQRPRKPAVLAAEARALVRGIADPAEPVAFLVARETAAVAIRDLAGLDQSQVGRHLSAVAEAALAAVALRMISDQSRQWGIPLLADGHPSRFAVLGLGKLGSREVTYASDMDVIFVCDPGGKCPRADHDGEEFWTRTAQALMRSLGERRIYEIDPRLRPWGDQGPLVANMEALAHYWNQPRDLWERMAMLRVSYLAGDPRLGEEAIACIRSAAIGRPLPGDARWQVRDMRRRLEESVAGRDHVKRGWGGYVDHEFLVEYHCLGLDPAQLPIGATIEDLLRLLTKIGRIPQEACDSLTSSLRVLRFAESRMRLAAGKAISSLPTEGEPRTLLARRCNYPDLAAFDLALHLARESARKWFDRLVPG